MISYSHLLNDDEVIKYQPLSTVKSIQNLPNLVEYDKVDIEKIFKSDYNQLMLVRNLYNINKNNGGKITIQKFKELVPKLQNKFCKINNLKNFDMTESESTGQKDWSLILKATNNKFIKHCYNLFKWNIFIPSRERTMVGPVDDRKLKKFTELLASDIPTIDVWEDVDQDRNNSNFWLDNKIPIWRESIHRRNYDKSNQGFRNINPDRASLENFQRSFNMDTIFSTIDNWQSSGWWGY